MTPRFVAALFAGALLASPARAEETEAEMLFTLGREAMQRGDPTSACRLFRESLALDPAIGTLLNIARCEEDLGRVASASKHYADVMAQSEPSNERYAYAKKHRDALEARIPWLTLRLAGADARVTISIDGNVVSDSELKAPIALDPGKHVIAVQAEDGVTKSYEIALAEAERRELELAPPPVATAPPSVTPAPVLLPPAAPSPPAPATVPVPQAPRPDGERSFDQRTAGWISLGVGATGLVLSGVAALIVLDRKAVVEEECDDNLVCRSQAGKDAADSGQLWSTIGTVAFVVGVAGTGAGTWLLLSAEPEQKSAFAGFGAAF